MAVDRGTDQTFRDFDPARGPFEPSGAQTFPPKTADNPQGVRHIDKTREDSVSPAERVRVQRAEARKSQPNHLRSNENV